MGSDLIPEKFALYFSTMSPLASKISSEISGIEDFLKSQAPPGGLSYSEKCSIVDKFLIYDHLPSKNTSLNKRLFQYQQWNLRKQKSQESLPSLSDFPGIPDEELVQTVYYGDPCLDQDHESVLLTSVQPKKLDKWIYDENGDSWLDEHSGDYTRPTLEQAKSCKLQEFLEKLPPPPVQPRGKYKSRVPVQEEEDRYKMIDKRDAEKKNRGGRCGAVNVFGGEGELILERKEKEEVTCKEEDLPQQVKNNDLMAELQEKLKRGKGGSVRMSKMKAPPPPPPGGLKAPGGAVKITSPLLGAVRKSPEREVNDDFVVDVSSPCKVVTRKTGLDFLDNW